jgi:hypothetical protein
MWDLSRGIPVLWHWLYFETLSRGSTTCQVTDLMERDVYCLSFMKFDVFTAVKMNFQDVTSYLNKLHHSIDAYNCQHCSYSSETKSTTSIIIAWCTNTIPGNRSPPRLSLRSVCWSLNPSCISYVRTDAHVSLLTSDTSIEWKTSVICTMFLMV